MGKDLEKVWWVPNFFSRNAIYKAYVNKIMFCENGIGYNIVKFEDREGANVSKNSRPRIYEIS